MKKFTLFLFALLMGVSAWAQNTPPTNVAVNALSHDKMRITWDIPDGTTQPTRLNLFNQADMVTHAGSGHNDADVSACYGGQSTTGRNASYSNKFWMADDFTLAAAASVREIEFYTYQTGSGTTSTITGCYVQIFDVQPIDSTAVPLWSSDTVSCMSSTSWTGIYRTGATNLTDSTRPIMRVVADINTSLPAGNYWVAVCFTGSLSSGPWCPPVAILGQVSTGNAIQYMPGEGVWGPWFDGASYEQMGIPFIVRGEFVSEDLRGFNVYRDNNQINSTLIEGFSYEDESLEPETEYCYMVEAVYVAAGATSMSESVCETTPHNPCRIVTLPYGESFDTYGTGYSGYPNVAYPTCWTKYNNTTATSTITNSYPYISTTYNSAPGSLYMYAGTNYYTMAITPLIDSNEININTLRATMMLRKTSASYQLIVGTIVDPTDPNTFEPYDTISPSATSTWQALSVDFNNYMGNAHYIALRSGSGSATNTIYVDDFVLDYIPSCEGPSEITVSGNTSNSITVSWTPITPASSWDIAYMMQDDEDWTEVNSITGTSYIIENLEPNTSYSFTFKVKPICAPDDEGAWVSESFTVSTSCVPVTEFPYTESFDTYGTGTSAYPNCWSKSHTQTTTSVSYPYISTTNNSAPGSLYFYSTSSYGVWAVTPYFDIDINTLQADYKLRKSSAAYKLVIGVISNPDDLNTFIAIDTVSPSETSTWESFTTVFDAYTGEGHYIAFVSNTGSTNYMYMDDLVIGEVQTCFAPSTISLEEATTSSATVVWNSTDEMASYDLRYRMVGEENWTTVYSISDTTYLLENLNSSSHYELQIHTICTDAVSYWSETFNFQTLCDPVVELPYFEGFEDYGSSTAGSEFPTCWSRPVSYSTSTTIAPFCNTTQKNSGNASLRFQACTWAATPQFEEDIHNLQVSFWLREEGPTQSGVFQVGVMSNPLDTSTFELVETIHPGALEDVWLYYEVNFNNTQLTGTGNVIAFRQANTTYTNWYYWLDDVDVHIIPTCLYPSDLIASNETQNSVDLSWHDNTNASSFTVRYRLAGTETWTEEITYDTTLTINGLTASSVYEWQVKAHCSETDESLWSVNIEHFSTECGAITSFPYMETFDVYGTGYSGFPNVAYPTCWTKFNNTTATSTLTQSYPYINTTNYSAPGSLYMYAGTNYYTMAMLPPIDSTINVNVNELQVSFMCRKTSAAYNVMIGVMTDPTDASTFVPLDTVSPTATSTWELFEVPLSDYQGTGRYITFRCGTGTATTGIYIDNLMVDYIPTCFRPNNVTISDISNNTATVSWSANGNESEWQLNYMTEGDEEWTEITFVTDTFYMFTDLTAGTTYKIMVKALCDDGHESEFSIEESFTTLCDPMDSVPFVENFDTYASGTTSFPDCWIRQTNSSTNYPYISTTSYSGSRGMYFYASTTTYCYAALPAFSEDVDIRDLQISFKGRKSSATYELEVGVMSDAYDLNSYTVVTTVFPAATSTWEDFTIYLNSYTGTGKHIVFKTPDGSETTFYIDDIEINYAPECLLPTNVRITNITSTEAMVHWGADEDETEWQIVYGPEGFSMDTVDPISIDVNPYTLSGLEPNTTYDVYLRTICNNGEISDYSPVTTFTTGCAPMELPYSEDFDSYGTGTSAYVDCWKKINNNTNYPYIYSTTSSTGLTLPGALYFYTTSSTYAYAILPEFDAELNTLQMSFAFKAAMGSGYHLDIGVMEDATDTSSFVWIQTIEPRTAVWNSFTVAFTAYEGTGKYIAIRSKRADASNTCYIDNLVVDYAPGCVAPMHLETDNITTTTVDVTWRPGRTENEWIVAYGPTNFNPNVEGLSQTVYEYPITLTDLEPGTFYDFYVKAICGDEESSEWSIKSSFRTDCLLIDTLPYTESFDTYGTGTAAFPNCWNRKTTYSTTTQYPYISSTYNNSEPGALYFGSTSTTYNYVTLPEFDESIDISSLRASFKLRKTSAAYHLNVGVMTDPNDKTTFVEMARVSPSATSTWEEFEVEFYNYTGEGHFIAFASDTTSSNYMYLDDVVISLAPTCHEVVNVAASDMTTDQATISWTPVFPGLSWDVEYGPAGFTQGSAEAQTISGITDTFTLLTGLTSSTQYDLYVRQICTGDDESPWSNKYTFTTECTPMSLPYTENFDNPSYVATTYNVAGMAPLCWRTESNNTTYPAPHIVGSGSYWYHQSGTNSLVFTGSSAGRDAYAVLPEFDVPLNTLLISFWRAMESTSYGELEVGYVTDLNNIATSFISVANITSIANTSGGGVDSVDFSTLTDIPATGRIAFHWAYPTGSSYYSCCIDDIHVETTVVCEQPTNVTVSNVTAQSASVTWTAGEASQWEVAYKTSAAETWNTQVVNNAMIDLTGLQAETEYNVRVRVICAADYYSNWSEVAYFTTAEESSCDTPEGLAVDNASITEHTATATWTAGEASAWNIQYKTAAATSWGSSIPVTSPTYTLTGLDADTEYQLRVQADCGTIGTSEWSAIVSFTTLPETAPCQTPTNLQVYNITVSSAEISWNGSGNETGWKVGYKLQSASQWQEQTVSVAQTIIEGLTEGSTYDVRVKALCEGGDESEFATTNFSTPVGINSVELVNSISLMPNPADNYIELNISNVVRVDEVTVYNAFGQLIQTVTLKDNQARIDLDGMASGMYFVRVNGEGVSATKKFIKK